MNMEEAQKVLNALPDDRKHMLVVRSMPFGAIIEDDTRKVHIVSDALDPSVDPYKLVKSVKTDIAAILESGMTATEYSISQILLNEDQEEHDKINALVKLIERMVADAEKSRTAKICAYIKTDLDQLEVANKAWVHFTGERV